MRRPYADRIRRRAAVFGGLALALAPTCSDARSSAPAPFTIVRLPGRAWVAIATEGTNAGFVEGSSGVLLVDCPANADAARLLLARIRSLTRRSPRWVLHTRAGDARSPGDRIFLRAGARVASSVPALDLGGTSAQISTAAVHAAGDVIVHLPGEDVVFAGDLFARGEVPDVSGADVGGWVKVLDGFLDQRPAAVFVGSRGQPGRALDVRYLRDYVSGLRQAVGEGLERGESGPELADRLIALQRARFGHWIGFDARARRNVEEVERALTAAKTPP